MSAIEVLVPDIGDFKDVEVIEVLVKPGDTIAKDQSLITVESDKASMEIPSSAAGVVKELRVKLGDKVSKGSAVLSLEASSTVPQPRPPRLPHRRRRRRIGGFVGDASQRVQPKAISPTSNATCWCLAPARVDIRPRFALRISARRRCWSSAMQRSVACV